MATLLGVIGMLSSFGGLGCSSAEEPAAAVGAEDNFLGWGGDKPRGESCKDNDECAKGLVCRGTSIANWLPRNKICQPIAKLDEICDEDADCEEGVCPRAVHSDYESSAPGYQCVKK